MTIVVMRDKKPHAEVILSATVPADMGVGSKKVKTARGFNAPTVGGEVSSTMIPAELH